MPAKILLAANPLPLALVTCLEDLGYEVTVVEEGQDVLRSLQRHTPSLLILDADMLLESDIGTCDRLHRSLSFAGFPIVMTSAVSGLREQSAARIIGAKVVLNSPVAGEVAAMAEGLLGGVQKRQEVEAEDARLWRTAS